MASVVNAPHHALGTAGSDVVFCSVVRLSNPFPLAAELV